MLPRIFYTGRPVHIRRRSGFIEVEFKDGREETERIPVGDLAVLIIDNKQATFTSGVLEAVSESKGIILVCDEKHYPSSLTFPLTGNYRNGHIVQFQASLSRRSKESLWKQIVTAKVKNQAALLRESGNENFKKLEKLLRKITVKNASDIESEAARIYWNNLFYPHIPKFQRDRKGASPNDILNYGYMVLRALIVRALVTAGLMPQLSLHHSPKHNALALADDWIEPFRPFIDREVLEIVRKDPKSQLDKTTKKQLLKSLYNLVFLDGHQTALINATLFSAITLAQVACKEREIKEVMLPLFDK